MAKKSTADIGFEKQIWEAACVLRGNLDASEYKSVVLGLIFLNIFQKVSFLFLQGHVGVKLQQRLIHQKLEQS